MKSRIICDVTSLGCIRCKFLFKHWKSRQSIISLWWQLHPCINITFTTFSSDVCSLDAFAFERRRSPLPHEPNVNVTVLRTQSHNPVVLNIYRPKSMSSCMRFWTKFMLQELCFVTIHLKNVLRMNSFLCQDQRGKLVCRINPFTMMEYLQLSYEEVSDWRSICPCDASPKKPCLSTSWILLQSLWSRAPGFYLPLHFSRAFIVTAGCRRAISIQSKQQKRSCEYLICVSLPPNVKC